MSGKFVVFACYWNDNGDWLEASLKQVLYWKPDEIYLCEGCFDKNYPARSTDGTREYLEKWAKDKDSVWIVDNIRDGKYRENQANTCNLVLRLADIKTGDWIMRVDCDAFYFKHDIDVYRNLMTINNFDYPIYSIWNFWNCIDKYYPHRNKNMARLPYRYIKQAKFMPTWLLTLNGKSYHESNKTTATKLSMAEFHYEGLRDKERLHQKYDVGDRTSPTKWKNGVKLKKRTVYKGRHPEFAIPVLEEKGYL